MSNTTEKDHLLMYDSANAFPEKASKQNFTVSSKGQSHHTLKINGSFKPGWLARLSSGLSEKQISILSGKGTRGLGLHWEAEFELVSTSTSSELSNIDFDNLIECELPSYNIENLEISDFVIHKDETAQHSVWVEVNGPDKIGFLNNVLKTFALYSLFPKALEISTDGAFAYDRFLLTGIAGASPSESALEGLKNAFQGLMAAA